ncbi:pentapeptide repeat-containing protein [Ruegeria atlantica]|uniref:pentapeptide repeat-containing protein n=1 Tax=Ruegeria atlantica TaxID=81569 RepID=UPI00147ACAC4|nr:pentapeptide repeat-containing protein [Ruegeria atlantica]
MSLTTLPIEPAIFWGTVWAGGLLLTTFLLFGAFPKGAHHTAPLEQFQQRLNLDRINPGIFLIALILWGLLFGLLFVGIVGLIWDFIWVQAPQTQTDSVDWRFNLVKLTATTAILGAVVAFPITVMNASYNRRQIEAQEKGQVTDRFTKAIEGLGADKVIILDGQENTVPNLEVRVGAVLALEKIASETPSEVSSTLDTLSVYVRENVGIKTIKPDTDADEDFLNAIRVLEFPRSDVRAAMHALSKVIKNKHVSETIVDLRTSVFRNLALVGLYYPNSDLRLCDFTKSYISSCDFSDASFDSGFFYAARFSESKLDKATFLNVEFDETKFTDCSMLGVFFQDCDLSDTNITQDQINASYGDASVNLPASLQRPKHWSKRIRSRETTFLRWQKFLDYKGYNKEKDSA